ncbi:SGNH/GDSL hydrolase family protein [Paenibacillus thermotolerans]|uniref:SGNH/GDSL hydrolase family protein n=1 Tax=Paenibacillus thermotolerans TaxID=3027807 RepID=UPI00236759D4|nr:MULTISPECIES: SGNH/GDSL hydrolase family protein [unclassified Paenibacillus]
MKLANNDKLLFIGDSITDCERKRPIGEGLFQGLGKGYVSFVDAVLNTLHPELAIRVVNMGTSGNTVRDLKERWNADVIELKPDWLAIMIGINDVWRQYDQPYITESHVYIEEYESTLRTLIEQTLPLVKGIVLMTPFYIEPNKDDAMRATMDRYGAVVKRIADEKAILIVDTQDVFDELTKHMYAATIAWDRVHPNATGHFAIARAFLNAIGVAWK